MTVLHQHTTQHRASPVPYCRATSPQVGYTQSLNFLAAFLLLQLPARVEGGLGREEAALRARDYPRLREITRDCPELWPGGGGLALGEMGRDGERWGEMERWRDGEIER